MTGAAVTVPELLELLARSIESASRARDNLRFDFFDSQHRVCVGLLHVVIEYATAAHTIAAAGMFYAPTPIHRAALEAYVDIANACARRDYCENLEAADAFTWKRLLQHASSGSNPLLKEIAEAEFFETGRRMYSDKVRELEKKGAKKLEPGDRFALAGLTDMYEAAYSMLSAESHNNISFVTSHYFDLSAEPPSVRPPGSWPGNGAPRAVTLNMAEIVLNSADKVLRLCGHGTAVLSAAMGELEAIHAKVLAGHPADDLPDAPVHA